ncbi:response regulator transcription factor [Paenibacillus tundrae]|uniref:DNA-binding response OmpR family regulator n=1 Tax=Paenibacillus tundrae TaxID=528187 RepID=A0ABT9W9T2_9BACL|nr:response regulator transcription factor [Paenibacillus tundrae]MDQ0169590.1 DNA-binding response OmpR family regulator [Paenibacillus tundrae]
MQTSILLVGTTERTTSIKEVLLNHSYTVVELRWQQLQQERFAQLESIRMIILLHGTDSREELSEGIEWLGQKSKPVPIVVLTYQAMDEEIVHWLDLGANDVILEPVHSSVLLARIRNLLRLFVSVDQMDEEVIVVHDLKVNLRSRRVSRTGEYLMLTPKEYELLEYLARHVNEACTRSMILSEVWGYEFAMDTNVVDVYIKHLREKVDKGRSQKLIHTVRGVGYMLHT